MKRILFICLTLLLLLSVSVTVVSAETGDASTPDESLSDGQPYDEETPDNPGTSSPDIQTPPAELPPSPEESDEDAGRTFGETINYIWDTYAGEIFSVLTLITSLVLAYFYKRGLVPIVWNGLDRINRAGAEATEAAKALAASTDERLSAFFTRAEPILSEIGTAAATATELAAYVKILETRVEENESERAKMEALMAGVADMLYGVFTSANLPAYAKEQIGARYHAITSLLRDSGDSHGEQETADA